VLVKPSKDQLKRTVWRPEGFHFDRKDREPIDVPPEVLELTRSIRFNVDPAELTLPSKWVRAINKLETNAYRINQNLLEVVNALVSFLYGSVLE